MAQNKGGTRAAHARQAEWKGGLLSFRRVSLVTLSHRVNDTIPTVRRAGRLV